MDAFEGLETVFCERFGRAPALAARAPGRVNLIGEHTDYNDGLVLPCAIDRATRVMAGPRSDGCIRVWSVEQQEEASFEVAVAASREPGGFGHWSDYLKCVVTALAERGLQPGGLDLAVTSEVPPGAGLSSSAAFTVSLAALLAAAAGAPFDPRAIADAAHRAESHFLGVGSGVLDPYASALGARDAALFIDCRSRTVERVDAPAGALCIWVADSGVRRSLAEAGSGYRQRVAECASARAVAREAGVAAPDATALRDLAATDLPRLESLLETTLLRRARHVVTENERVLACRTGLETGDLGAVGDVLRAGHRSLRDDYEVSIPELDALCEIGDDHPGVYGSRLTGAGFGGCTIHLADPAADDVGAVLADSFARRFGRTPEVVRIETADGAELLAL